MPVSARISPSKPDGINSSKLTKRAVRLRSPQPDPSQLDFEQDGEVVDYQPPELFDISPLQPSTFLQRSEILRRPLAYQNSRRNPLRMDTQDGPWSISVAESPSVSLTYCIYIKTPTLHLTLTRASSEISLLHSKLRDSYPSLALPPLPFDPSIGSPGGKRKASFLNTLSRLTSPGPKPRMPYSHATQELPEDAFMTSPQSLTTCLASYLTALSNDQIVRVSKAWRRFVRVRTDDLESVRVERAIKRVRSDLAKHTSSPVSAQPSSNFPAEETVAIAHGECKQAPSAPKTEPRILLHSPPAMQESVNGLNALDITGKSLLDDENTAIAAAMATVTPDPTPSSTPALLPCPLEAPEEAAPSTSKPDILADVASDISPFQNQERSEDDQEVEAAKSGHQVVHRLPRSASADPDKATRLSRVYKMSGLDSLVSTTDDESIAQSDASRPNGAPKGMKRKVVIDDFEMMRVLGKGCAGKVLLVRHKASDEMYALKAITKRHVLAHQELQHTLTEQAVLKRMAKDGADPFVVKLWWSFHDKENLFLVMDFHPGGDLATQLARWGRLGRDRARFYAAEIVEGVEGLHAAGVIYRDLKPENILIGVDGHIVLTDFGLSKEFPRQSTLPVASPTAPATPSAAKTEYYNTNDVATPSPYWMKGEDGNVVWLSPQATDLTSTFCGTAEYLAPEVIQGLPYSYEVDWWSFGTMLYEMLSGITPFWANNHSDMYVRVLQDELQFPEDRSMDQDTRSLIRGLLQRNPALRIKEPRIKRHPYFSMIDWGHVYYKRYIPPYIPPVEAGNPSDTQNFDDAFLEMDPTLDAEPEPEGQTTDSEREKTDDDRTDGEESIRTPAQSRSPSVHPVEEEIADLFDGYSFKGRQSVVIDGDEEEGAIRYGSDTDELVEDEEQMPNIIPEVMAQGAEGQLGDSDNDSVGAKTPEAKHPSLPQVDEAEEDADVVLEQDTASESRSVSFLHNNEGDSCLPEGTVPIYPLSSLVDKESTKSSGESDLSEASKSQKPSLSPTNEESPIKSQALAQQTTSNLDSSHWREDHLKTGRADDDDDDWDLVEAPGEEHQNGARAPTLFARGVVDRYRLVVFRRASNTRSKRSQRYFSGNSTDAETDIHGTSSPASSEKLRRGRAPGLSLRAPKQFLRAKSPPISFSPNSSANSRAALSKSSANLSAAMGSFNRNNSSSFSLKSKPSTTSVTAGSIIPSDQSDSQLLPEAQLGNSASGSATPLSPRSARPSISTEEQLESKIKKIKKNYKEGAEKVLSLFSSPR